MLERQAGNLEARGLGDKLPAVKGDQYTDSHGGFDRGTARALPTVAHRRPRAAGRHSG